VSGTAFKKNRVEQNWEDILLEILSFSQRILLRLRFSLGFLELVVVKCSDVSEGHTRFLFRTILLP
jgi:hypothetical protein